MNHELPEVEVPEFPQPGPFTAEDVLGLLEKQAEANLQLAERYRGEGENELADELVDEAHSFVEFVKRVREMIAEAEGPATVREWAAAEVLT